jgi:2-oxoglutarate dehydrogenase complex dehydrogenase (E1) component-like enzyme
MAEHFCIFPYRRLDVRISGQDERGTFSHRHAVKVEDSEEEVTLIDRLEGKQNFNILFTIRIWEF